MRYLLSFLIFFLIQTTFAQGSLDSMYFFQQNQQLAESWILSPTFKPKDAGDRYGTVALNQQMGSGSFRKAQQAYANRMTSFAAKGYNQIGRFHIGATFTFYNQYEDSLANSLRSSGNELTPFYPYANQAGRYQRQTYALNAALGFQATPYLQPFVKLDYQYHWSAGTIDPRLKSSRFELRAKPGIAFSWNAHRMGIYGLVGKGDEQVGLSFKNDVFANSTLYPDRIYHLNYGYGSSVIRDFSNNYRYDSYLGGGMEYASVLGKWTAQAAADFQLYHNTNQITPKGSIYYAGVVGVFDLQTWKANVDLFGPRNAATQQSFHMHTVYQNGFDGNTRTTGSLDIVNYKVNTFDISAAYRILWDKNKSVSKEVGLDVQYASSERQDLIQSVFFQVADLHIGTHLRGYLQRPSGQLIKLYASPYLKVPVQTSLSYNDLSKSAFVRDVIFTDYYYHAARYLGSQIEAEYIGQFFGTNYLGFYANFDYRQATRPKLRTDFAPTFVPAGARWEVNLGVRMYIQ